MNADFPIDFVIPWVDGSDPEWIKVFNNYVPKEKQIDARNIRYRDFGLLKYWFRAVEKFTPWVNKVHFITCGQKPDFLNLNCLKLHFVKHSDYIPDDCLPAFSTNPIELNIHRINGLSDHFVYFNDDYYITKPLKRDFFFKDGLPCDSAVLEVKTSGSFPMVNIVFNDLNAINKNFKPKESVKNNPCKEFVVAMVKLTVTFLLSIGFFVGLYYLFKNTGWIGKFSNVAELKIILSSAGFWSYAVFAVMQFLQVSIIPMPASVSTIVGVICFGPWIAFGISLVAILLGSIFAYIVYFL